MINSLTAAGLPLSEIPEFWRAALEEAVAWGGEVVGHPPSPGLQSLGPDEPDFDGPPASGSEWLARLPEGMRLRLAGGLFSCVLPSLSGC